MLQLNYLNSCGVSPKAPWVVRGCDNYDMLNGKMDNAINNKDLHMAAHGGK